MIHDNIAVLEVKGTEEYDTLQSCRTSISSTASDQNVRDSLELEQIIHVLQSDINVEHYQQDKRVIETNYIKKAYGSSKNDQPNSYTHKQLKREEQLIVDYELDHHIINSSRFMKNCFSSNDANLISLSHIDIKAIKENALTPREQEKARLGSMAFLKAVMTLDHQVTKDAINTLTATYQIANTQIERATKRNIGNTVTQYFSACRQYMRLSKAVPTHIKPANPKHLEMHRVEPLSNGILRAHVVKAEACLQIAVLYLLQENISGYIKCGLNLRRAYASYSIAWQEYKRMGQLHNEYIDRDTISGIQFGIGSVHLILSSLPQKVLQAIAAFGWTPDKHLGFVLLKLCLENRRARSPMASIMLLAYYTTLTSICPQLLVNEYTQPAIETLLDAQSIYPNSAIFLYFAGRTSRLARNLALSSQSFLYAKEISKNEWAEVETFHMCSYEISLNHMMNNEWKEANDIFNVLYKDRYWSQAIFRYLSGACLEMMGERTQAILAFAEVPALIKQQQYKNTSASTTEHYILNKIKLLQSSGYQDMDLTLCALEYLYLMNAIEFMGTQQLELNLELVDYALSRVLETEKLEYNIRMKELLPETPLSQYEDQRGLLLLLKISLLNAMGRFQESVMHLNWIIDHKSKIVADKWIIPHAFWEAGITSWNLDQKSQSLSFWEIALKHTNYDFEHRLSMKVNLAMKHAQGLGICATQVKKQYRLNSSIICTSNNDVLYDSGINVYRSSSQTESTIGDEDEENEPIVTNKSSKEENKHEHSIDQLCIAVNER
ncbi:hypothetical protein G6F61_003395 [Rhizopus arrhizus]|nr:hypothetical protein G6F61_003395 [Rhizopus arrhizus]